MQPDTLNDYEVIDRKKNQSSMKYFLTFQRIQLDVDPKQAIVVNYADMEFKLSPVIYQKLVGAIETPHFGYVSGWPSFWQAIRDWVRTRYQPNVVVTMQTTTFWNNMLSVFTGVMTTLTCEDDGVLIMVPTYYRYISDTQFRKRRCVEFELSTHNNRLYIDFERLEQTLKHENVRLMILANPWNPCGRIWQHSELTQLKDLLTKYKIYVFADEIFSDAIEAAAGQQLTDVFTSLLCFPDLYPYLIYANSFSKAYNCSGMALSYTICPDPQLFKKMSDQNKCSGAWPSTMSYHLIEICYTDPGANQWRLNTIQYIRQNYQCLKSLCGDQLPKLIIYDLQCSYLVLVDFKEYNLNFEKLEKYFSAVNLCPTFMRGTFVDLRSTSLVRLNIACNRTVVAEVVDRMAKITQMQWIE